MTDVQTRTSAGAGVSLHGLSHSFVAGDATVTTALSRVDLEVAPGEIVALTGQSGCGKSTILNILAGLLTPTGGSFEVRDGRGDGVGYITQEDRLLPWRTVLRNVELPAELQGAPRGPRRETALRLLDRVGLGDVAGKRPDQLSGGMRQRASIARALTLHPSLLLMDEPFGALDAWTRTSLHELLIDVQRQFATTILIVTHDVDEALALADRVVTLAPRPGRIIGDYSVPDTRSRPRQYRDLHEPALFELATRVRSDLGLTEL